MSTGPVTDRPRCERCTNCTCQHPTPLVCACGGRLQPVVGWTIYHSVEGCSYESVNLRDTHDKLWRWY